MTTVTLNFPYAKSLSLEFHSQRHMGVGGFEDICDNAAI